MVGGKRVSRKKEILWEMGMRWKHKVFQVGITSITRASQHGNHRYSISSRSQEKMSQTRLHVPTTNTSYKQSNRKNNFQQKKKKHHKHKKTKSDEKSHFSQTGHIQRLMPSTKSLRGTPKMSFTQGLQNA